MDEVAEVRRLLRERGPVGNLAQAKQIGALLLELRESRAGNWQSWLAEHVPETHWRTAATYMRIAHYVDELPEDVSTVSGAVSLLNGRPDIFDPMDRGGAVSRRLPSEVKAEIRALLNAGWSSPRVAQKVGVSDATVYEVLDPKGYRAKKRAAMKRTQEAHKALRAQQAQAAASQSAKERGGYQESAYSLVRQLAQHLDKAIAESDRGIARGEVPRRLREARQLVYDAEERIMAALNLNY